ncbi:50S ribosomal subunit stability factor [Gammaproteobacteria bacterium]
MLPVIAIVGHPNVGKSTLFNVLTRSRDALVADFPGLTRDRQYGLGRFGPRPYRVIDTGGFTGEREGLLKLMSEQAMFAVQEADVVLFLVDAKTGLTAADEEVAEYLRRLRKPIFLVVNKAEGQGTAMAAADFMRLGFADPIAISAVYGQGINLLLEKVFATQPALDDIELNPTEGVENDEGSTTQQPGDRPEPWVAVVGRPNVGKSTLINRLLGEERLLASDQPGTTRDSIHVPFASDGRNYTLIDTAGIRRRGRVTEMVEKFSVVKTLQAIDTAHVVILVMDAHQGVSDQDTHLVGHVLEAGRGLVVAVNKWDGLDTAARAAIKEQIDRQFPFMDFAPFQYISALRGSGLSGLLGAVDRVYASATCRIPTPLATRLLQDAVAANAPPMVHGRRIKLRFAHQGGRNPPRIIVHGNQAEAVPEGYRRYLANAYRKALELVGTPLVIEFKGNTNPYEGRPNPLSARQAEKRRRIMRHTKR